MTRARAAVVARSQSRHWRCSCLSGAAQAKSYSLPQAVVARADRVRRLAARPRGHHVLVLGLVLGRVPGHSRARGRARRPRFRERGWPPLPARRQHRARELRPARQVRRRRERRSACASSGTTERPTAASGRSRSRYRFRGLAVAYDDVVDVNLQVWGDEWPVAVYDLRAEMELPRPIALQGTRYRVWGAPAWVNGVVERTRTGTTLRAVNVPAGQFVEMRTVFPRRLLTSTRGARVVEGQRLRAHRRRAAGTRGRLRREPQEDRRGERQPRPDAAHARGLLARRGRRSASSFVIWFFFGRERGTGYDREYEQEPPSRGAAGDRAAAAAPGNGARVARVHGHALRPHPARLLRREAGDHREEDLGGPAHAAGRGSRAVARRRVGRAGEVRGAGRQGLRPHRRRRAGAAVEDARPHREDAHVEQQALRALQGGSVEGDRQARLVPRRRSQGLRASPSPFFVIAAVVLLWMGISGFRPESPRWTDIVQIALGVCAIVNAVVLDHRRRQHEALAASHARPVSSRPSAGRRSAAISRTFRGWTSPRRPRSRSGSGSSSTGSPSGSPSACSRARSSTCPRSCTRPARSTGSARTATSARGRAPSPSATSRRASARRWHRPPPAAPAAPAAASRAAAEAAEAAAAAAPGRSRRHESAVRLADRPEAVETHRALGGRAHAATRLQRRSIESGAYAYGW